MLFVHQIRFSFIFIFDAFYFIFFFYFFYLIKDGGKDGPNYEFSSKAGNKFRFFFFFFCVCVCVSNFGFGSDFVFFVLIFVFWQCTANILAGHELKGANKLFQFNGIGLHVPLSCLVDYHGFRLMLIIFLPFI